MMSKTDTVGAAQEKETDTVDTVHYYCYKFLVMYYVCMCDLCSHIPYKYIYIIKRYHMYMKMIALVHT